MSEIVNDPSKNNQIGNTEDANIEFRDITLPKHLWAKIDERVAQINSQRVDNPESRSSFLHRAISSFLDELAEGNDSQ